MIFDIRSFCICQLRIIRPVLVVIVKRRFFFLDYASAFLVVSLERDIHSTVALAILQLLEHPLPKW